MYASLGDLKLSLRIANTDDDDLLQVALDAAKELIDDHCNRTFEVPEAATERVFTPKNGRIDLDDLASTDDFVVSVAGVLIPAAVYNVSAGYELLPSDAPARGEPYTALVYDFPMAASWPLTWAISGHRAHLTGFWTYSLTVPKAVKQAQILQASRIFSRRLAPFGVAGSPEIGSEIRLLSKVDPDVAVLLSGKVRYR